MSTLARINEIFAGANDFEICSAVTSAIESQYGFYDLLEKNPDIPRDRWVAHSVFGNTGFFECEGYGRFWGTESDHQGFADALREIGFPILAGILDKAIPLVPAKILGDHNAVEAHENSREARHRAGDLMDEKLIREHPDITGRLATYIRARKDSYADLIDEISTHIEGFRKKKKF